jgi:cyclopropane fatty-acyl-phospholipid synthase-like methyltransferase
MLPYSEACERNKGPILDVLREAFGDRQRVIEIGAGTGQHAVHFARHLPHLTWQPTDRPEYLDGLAARIAAEGPPNVAAPLALDVLGERWPPATGDAVFSANTLHIMSWQAVNALFAGLPRLLPAGGVLAIYGPFSYGGRYTAPSNAAFDAMLRERDPDSGLRDVEAVNALAAAVGLELQADHSMPANNQLLVWRGTYSSSASPSAMNSSRRNSPPTRPK